MENIETVRRACINFVVIQVEEYVITDDETQLSEKLVNQINSSSRFTVDNKHLKPTIGLVWIYIFFFLQHHTVLRGTTTFLLENIN